MDLSQYVLLVQPYVQNVWLQAALIFLVFLVLAKVLQIVINKVALRFAKKTKTKLDDMLIESTKKPLFYLVIFIGLRTALIPLSVGTIIENIVESIGSVLFVYIFAVVINIFVGSSIQTLARKTKSNIDKTIRPLLQKAVGIVFFVIGVLSVLNVWKINITPYLAGLGISGLVVGLALQDSLANIFGGISLVMDQNFNVGDKVKLEGGELGEVLDIGLRTTQLRTYDNEIIFIPNGRLANTKIQNYVKPNPRVRVVVEFAAEYGTDLDKVKRVIMKVLTSMKDVSKDPYMDVVFTEMDDSNLIFEARFFVEDYRIAYNKKLEATEKIYLALVKSNIDMAYPTRTIYIRKE